MGQWYDKRWHKRLVLLLYIGLHQKWIKKGDDNFLKGVRMETDRSDPSDTKSTTNKKFQSAGETTLRNRCHNLLHMATLVIMDKQQQQRKQRLIEYFAEPMRKWLGVQAKLPRSSSVVRDFCVKEASGDWISVCNECVDITYAGNKLERLGIVVELAPYHNGMVADHPEVVEQDELAEMMVRFMLQLIRFRVRQALRWTHSLPLRFAAFPSPDKAIRSEALSYCRDSWRAWLATGQVEVGLSKKVYHRSFCNFTSVQVMCNYGERVDWKEITPMMLQHARNMFDPAMGQSMVIEDWGQRARACESASPSGACKATSAWFSALRAGLLSDVHHWDEVSYADESASELGKKAVPKGRFQPRAKDMTVNHLYEGYPKGENPTWPTFSSGSEVQLCVDSIMLIKCAAQDDWTCSKGLG